MPSGWSELETIRLKASPELPPTLSGPSAARVGGESSSVGQPDKIKATFPQLFGQGVVTFDKTNKRASNDKPLKIGVVLSGGQASGGHNVISGLYDYIKKHNKNGQLIGFKDGPHGIFSNIYMVLDDERIDRYRNQGGFDIIGSGRHKIETEENFNDSLKACEALNLDGLVVIGGDDSNTNAGLLAEYFKSKKSRVSVCGVPKTIDGDLKSSQIESSFGFDTATKTYSELVGNICTDCVSAKKYWHFVRLMGRDASHITLEVALQTHPNYTFISEEVKEEKKHLAAAIKELADLVVERSNAGKNYGVVLIPEGLIDFFPDVNPLMKELNEVMAGETGAVAVSTVRSRLSPSGAAVFNLLPPQIQAQLCLDRDPHGNVKVSQIETEGLIADMVKQELEFRRQAKEYSGSFTSQLHFFGYEGRCALPSLFDSNYCYSLGHVAGLLIHNQMTGYMATIHNLHKPVEEWTCGGTPLTSMMNYERRKGKDKPVIKKALVELSGAPFKRFASARGGWRLSDSYRNPGPIQFFGASAHNLNITLQEESKA